jgi:quercetin dioxygenase-like cupin family protein
MKNPMPQGSIQMLPKESTEHLPFEWGHLTWFANRALGNSDKLTLGRCVLKPGMSNPRHYHPNCTELLVVLSGRIMHTSGPDEERQMETGDVVSIPANNWHCARNIGDCEAVLLIAFTSADRETIGE